MSKVVMMNAAIAIVLVLGYLSGDASAIPSAHSASRADLDAKFGAQCQAKMPQAAASCKFLQDARDSNTTERNALQVL